mmetsp:Transcript_61420/g.180179  ORF Transcript_61420/g.180179 Transcript_61420/m.180179 type:complete len:338 (+) Transcript_61420:311-1324(+)
MSRLCSWATSSCVARIAATFARATVSCFFSSCSFSPLEATASFASPSSFLASVSCSACTAAWARPARAMSSSLRCAATCCSRPVMLSCVCPSVCAFSEMSFSAPSSRARVMARSRSLAESAFCAAASETFVVRSSCAAAAASCSLAFAALSAWPRPSSSSSASARRFVPSAAAASSLSRADASSWALVARAWSSLCVPTSSSACTAEVLRALLSSRLSASARFRAAVSSASIPLSSWPRILAAATALLILSSWRVLSSACALAPRSSAFVAFSCATSEDAAARPALASAKRWDSERTRALSSSTRMRASLSSSPCSAAVPSCLRASPSASASFWARS